MYIYNIIYGSNILMELQSCTQNICKMKNNFIIETLQNFLF